MTFPHAGLGQSCWIGKLRWRRPRRQQGPQRDSLIRVCVRARCMAASHQNARTARAESQRSSSKDGLPFATGPRLGRYVRSRDCILRDSRQRWCGAIHTRNGQVVRRAQHRLRFVTREQPYPSPDNHHPYDNYQHVDRQPLGYALRRLFGHDLVPPRLALCAGRAQVAVNTFTSLGI